MVYSEEFSLNLRNERQRYASYRYAPFGNIDYDSSLLLIFVIQVNYMNIFVTKLNYGTSEVSLKELFENYGEVSSAKIIMDRETGRSKGYGFVEMEDESAKEAISELNETEFEGNTIIVKEARPRESSGRGGYNSNRNFNRY